MYISYRCINCGKHFYFYGLEADAMIRYRSVIPMLSKMLGLEAEPLFFAIDRRVKCCKHPNTVTDRLDRGL